MTAPFKQLTDDIFLKASIFGVTLNGQPARLDIAKSGLAEVKSPTNRAVFNWSTAVAVVNRHKGQFKTAEARV